MSRIINDEVVKTVGAGIREYNANTPPGVIRFDREGKQVPPTTDERIAADTGWHAAIRHGLDAALPLLPIHFNQLTPAEAERLAVLIEEAAEVQQIACKILRHGYQSWNPDLIVNQRTDGSPKLTNREMLEKELGHLHSAMKRLQAAHDVSTERLHYHTLRKDDNGGQYMHHQPDAPQEQEDE